MGKQTVPGMSHSVGASHILKGRGYLGPRDDFERVLLLSLRGPVVRSPFLLIHNISLIPRFVYPCPFAHSL